MRCALTLTADPCHFKFDIRPSHVRGKEIVSYRSFLTHTPTMAPSAQAHKRSHSLLLLQKLLNLRDSASPLTLVLDTLEQSATPLVDEFVTRAKVRL